MTQISLYAFINKEWTDITEYIGDMVTVVDNYDVTLDNATITILLKEDSIQGLPGSAQLKPGLPCYIKYHNTAQIDFYVLDEDTVEPYGTAQAGVFKHTLKLVEPANELRFTKIPDMSFTQPVGDIKLNSIDYRILTAEYSIDSQPVSASYGVVNTVPNLDVLKDNALQEGNLLKAGKTYQINVSYSFNNDAFYARYKVFPLPYRTYLVEVVGGATDTSFKLTLNKASNNAVYATISDDGYVTVPAATVDNLVVPKYGQAPGGLITEDPSTWYTGALKQGNLKGTLYYSVTPNEDVYIKLEQNTKQAPYGYHAETIGGVYNTIYNFNKAAPNRYMHAQFNISIMEVDEQSITGNKIMLDKAVDKVLNNINSARTMTQPPRYTLDPATRNRISSTAVSDMQLVGYNAWEALIKLASEVEAIPYLTGPTLSTIKFLYKNESPEGSIDNLLITNKTTSLNKEDYVRGYSVDINNLVNDLNVSTYIQDPIKGYYSVRSTQANASQITEDNAIYILKHNIYDKHKFLFKGGSEGGIKVKLKDGSTNLIISDNTGKGYWDMTKYILEEKQYLAQDNYPIITDEERRTLKLQKGNTLYYKKGGNEILGLGHRPPARPGFIVDKEQELPALIQMFVTAAMEKAISDGVNSETLTFNGFENYNLKKDVFTNVELKAIYPIVTNTNINLYKYNTESSSIDRVMTTSTSDYQTSVNRLSKYLTSTINEKGNVSYIIDGLAKADAAIPSTGALIKIDDIDYRVNTREVTYGKVFNRFTLVLAENLVNQNTNVGLNDERRSFEIADTNIVERVDKFKAFIKLIASPSDDNINKNDNIDFIKYRASSITNVYDGKQMLSKSSIPLFNKNKDHAITAAHLTIKPSVTDPDIKLIYPLNSSYLNTTMVFETEFVDNYSAGSVIDYEAVPGDTINFKGNQPFNYTSVLGDIKQIDIRMLSGDLADYSISADEQPKTDTEWTNTEATKINLSYEPNKDSREKLKLQAEVTYIAQEPESTIIFPALARYSPMLDRSISNKEDESIHTITYAYLSDDFEPTLTDAILDVSNIVLLESDVNTWLEPVKPVYGRYVGNNLTASESEDGAEIYGLRIPTQAASSTLAVYNAETLEVLFYHKLIDGVNTFSGVSDLWFVPYNNLTNHVDDLSTTALGDIDINVTVRHNPTNGSPSAETVFNLSRYATLNDILNYPQIYTTNVSSYTLPDKPYVIINRANNREINGDNIIYKDLSIDLVYESQQPLSPPVITSVINSVCDEIQLRVLNPNPTNITLEVDYGNGSPLANYSLSSLEDALLPPRTGFNKSSNYIITMRAKINSDTDPAFTSDSIIVTEFVRMPSSCIMRLAKPNVNIYSTISGDDIIFTGVIENYNPESVTASYRLTINDSEGSWIDAGTYDAYQYKSFEIFRGSKSTSYNVKLEAYLIGTGAPSQIASKELEHKVLKWEYLGPAPSETCFDLGYPMIGTTCSIEGEVITIGGSSDGYPGCIRIKCTKQ